MSFRDDLHEASEWAASYLDRVADLPVAADVRPGQVRSALPDVPPEQPEPFADVLRDLEDVILPAITHWNHPRFFAWFSNTGSEPGILAELLIAALNVNCMTWLASPAATELETTTLDWLAQLIGLPREWHGHIEDTASTATVAALAAARHERPGGAVYASEEANFSVEKAARLLGLEYRKVETDEQFRMRADFSLDDATAVVATVGTTATTSVDPVSELERAVPMRAYGSTSTRRTPAVRRCAPSFDGASTGATAPTRLSSTRTSGSSRRWTAQRSGHVDRRPYMAHLRSSRTTWRRRPMRST
jgi:aromatic-L-amino-acid decarboxylase